MIATHARSLATAGALARRSIGSSAPSPVRLGLKAAATRVKSFNRTRADQQLHARWLLVREVDFPKIKMNEISYEDDEFYSFVWDIRSKTVSSFQKLFPKSTEEQQAATESNNKEKPSIYLEAKFPNRIQISNGMYFRSFGLPDKWYYVAYMIKCLDFNVNSYIEYMKKKQNLILGYYDFCIKKHLNSNSGNIGDFMQSLMVRSCFQVFAILLFTHDCDGHGFLIRSAATRDFRPEISDIFFRETMKYQMNIKIDMLRLDSQIPWVAVEAIFSNSNMSELSGTSIDKLAMSCFSEFYPKENKSKVQGGTLPTGGFRHLLHIFHWTRAPEGKWLVSTQSPQPAKSFRTFYMPSATELLESATSLERLCGASIDVTHREKVLSGQIQITPLYMFEYSKELFMNLFLFEQKYLDCGMPFTAYMAIMIRLLETREDVRLLGKNGLVRNTSTNQEEVFNFIIDMRKELLLQWYACIPDELNSLSMKLNEHRESKVSRDATEIKIFLLD